MLKIKSCKNKPNKKELCFTLKYMFMCSLILLLDTLVQQLMPIQNRQRGGSIVIP